MCLEIDKNIRIKYSAPRCSLFKKHVGNCNYTDFLKVAKNSISNF